MKRANDIKERLAYALWRYRELASDMAAAQKEDKDVLFIGQRTFMRPR